MAFKDWNVRLIALALICCGLTGCAVSLARNGVPAALAEKVDVSGAPQIRYWGDAPIPDAVKISQDRLEQVRLARPERLRDTGRPISFLAISGGGADGAFGAGLLNGWTRSGKRPEFEGVTGVSAGALTAPFAFLGAKYDRQLKEIFTSYATEDLLTPQILSGLTGGSAVTSSAPLEALIEKYMSSQVLREIASEHRRGRRLFVGTTNLDSGRPVIWNMGAIAALESDASAKLFRQILLASVSIPGAFPPVFITVEAGSQQFQEMHVDGGTTSNAFLVPTGFDLRGNVGTTREIEFYIIANSQLTPTPDTVAATTFAIAGRSISTLIEQQLAGDLLKIYLAAKRNKVDFKLASIPSEFREVSKETFDRAYMLKLFETGSAFGRENTRWQDRPPGAE